MTRSVSQVEQYEKCPHQYKLQRIEKVAPRPAAWSHQGTAVHSAVEAYERSGRVLSEDQAANVFSVEYAAATKRALAGEPRLHRWMTAGTDGQSDIEARYILGMDQTREYVRWAEENKPSIWKGPDGDLGIEKHLTADIGGVKVQGYVDQLINQPDDSVKPRDFKTGSTKSRFQLECYTVLTRKVLRVEVNEADWFLGKTGKLSKPLDVSQVTEEAVAERFVKMDQGVKNGLFPAKTGFHCRFCDVSHACTFRKG